MNNYRITKYNPKYRNDDGTYQKDEWILYSQIGQEFEDGILTKEKYEKIENSYATALSFVEEANIDHLVIHDLQNHKGGVLKNNSKVSKDRLKEIIRDILREKYWCRLQGNNGFYIHFGWDYYMYLGTPFDSAKSKLVGKKLGLFIEEIEESPYKKMKPNHTASGNQASPVARS